VQCSLSDVHDAATLDEIAVQIRMEMYDATVAHKMQEWNKIAGSVTAQRAMACDDKQFASLIGWSPRSRPRITRVLGNCTDCKEISRE
jgi:hypothetical protein